MIVMYHYVRPVAASAWPRLKGLELDDFRFQLDRLGQSHRWVSMEQVLEAANGGAPLPEAAALLTFDDGYRDHAVHALPELLRHGIKAAFYPPVRAATERELLDVNKLHFILASLEDPGSLVDRVEDEASSLDRSIDLPTLRALHWKRNRFDDIRISYLKKLLQSALPQAVRTCILDGLFEHFVSHDQAQFADDLYMGLGELERLVDMGMHVGGHGVTHRRLSLLDRAEQEAEVAGCLPLLNRLGVSTNRFSFCYPYGDCDGTTLEVVAQAGFRGGVSTRATCAVIGEDNPLCLPRLDTTDILRS
ncbi:polysaccharide deacetylase family protein [Azospirillum argentinense]